MSSQALATFAGRRTLQRWADLMLWEHVLNEEKQLKGIVELGTWEGGFAYWLSAQSLSRGLRFATVDRDPPARHVPGFKQLDVWSDDARDVVRELLAKPGILLCDDGDKPREVERFAPILEPGELLAVHDWESEIDHSAIPPQLELVYGDVAEELGAWTRMFRRR